VRPGWVPGLVAVDADGTIVGPDDLVPEEITAKLRAIDASGVPVVVVTGRSWLSAQLVLDQVKLPHGYCVCNNGATVVTYPPMAVIGREHMDPGPIMEVLKNYPTVVAAVEEFGEGYRVSQPFPDGGMFTLHGEVQVETLAGLGSRPVSRVLLWDPVVTDEEFAAFMADLDLSGLWWVKEPGVNWLDIGPATGGKDKGLQMVAETLGVDRADVLAIGDGVNDVEFLRWAGRGVALGHAPEELLAVADAVTGTFDAGGTLAELTRWFPDT